MTVITLCCCCVYTNSGVESVDANVENKTVIVEANPSVTPEAMLEALKKVRTIVGVCMFVWDV